MSERFERRRDEPVSPVIDITDDTVEVLLDRSPEGRKLLS